MRSVDQILLKMVPSTHFCRWFQFTRREKWPFYWKSLSTERKKHLQNIVL